MIHHALPPPRFLPVTPYLRFVRIPQPSTADVYPLSPVRRPETGRPRTREGREGALIAQGTRDLRRAPRASPHGRDAYTGPCGLIWAWRGRRGQKKGGKGEKPPFFRSPVGQTDMFDETEFTGDCAPGPPSRDHGARRSITPAAGPPQPLPHIADLPSDHQNPFPVDPAAQ